MKRVSGLVLAVAIGAASLTGAPPIATASPVEAVSPVEAASPVEAGPAEPSDVQAVFVGELNRPQFATLTGLGVDRGEIATGKGSSKDTVAVEVILSRQQAAELAGRGVRLTAKKTAPGRPDAHGLKAQGQSGHTVFRSYSEPGGIKDEMISTAAAHPALTKLVVLGKTVRGKDIVAVKVTRNATKVRDGSRPAVLYSAAQHAREWITPEMNRRLMHHFIDGYATDPAIRKILNTTELWFVPVANPDGYDYTFTPGDGNRLWRKNLRDNNGDGKLAGVDGVDLNRNFPANWGYDNEGSSPTPSSETYRGTSPASEPETRALDGLLAKLKPAFLVNYHSAAELLLYGAGWQVSTPTPDDQISIALAGDDANPAVPGYDPDQAAELYTTNGETDDRASTTYGTVAFTPEMSTCQSASAVDPNDAFEPNQCPSVFNFPDSEALIDAEYRKNLPFALSVARSAVDPDDPVSSLGLTAPDFDVDTFSVSYGDPQTVAVTARRALKSLRVNYSINGGKVRHAGTSRWKGGERYGKVGDEYYAQFRGTVRGAKAGDRVEVWFSGRRAQTKGAARTERQSKHFSYTVASRSRAKVLVIADEDYDGVNPTYPSSVTAPKYAAQYVAGLKSEGIGAVVWDVSERGVPHHLGVLDHFAAVVWYLGDNRLTQDPEDELTSFYGQFEVRDAAVAERAQYLTMSVRDYLNEGGKLLHTGETAAYYGGSDGLYYGLNGAPERDCVVTQDPYSDCLLLSDDFAQYYLGAWSRGSVDRPARVVAGAAPFAGTSADFGGPAAGGNPLNEAGFFTATGDVLAPSRFPRFASRATTAYRGVAGGVYDPVEGNWGVAGPQADGAYRRLARTVDLSTATPGQKPSLNFALSYNTELGYDSVIIEAHPVGSDNWTSLPEAHGLSDSTVPTDCVQQQALGQHPFLRHYLSEGDPECSPTGTTGAWNRLTGDSGGWKQVSFDLSRYAGSQVEVMVSFVTDGAVGGTGVFIDDTRIMIGGTATGAEGFESGLGAWSTPGPPAGSPSATGGFARSQGMLPAAVTTADTVLFGFGVEQLETPAERADLLGAAMKHLLG